nr:serine/threonine-protein kinase [Kofleriaceae bacterium]
MLVPGDIISAYRVVEMLGSGGMGWVYRAAHVVQPHVAALKLLRADQLRVESSLDRMMREATILACVSHPGIPHLFECGMLPDRRSWIAMELVDGGPLSARGSRVLSPGEVRSLVRDVAEVLAAAHARGVTHRDLKPDNILIAKHGFPVRVIDWGIAHRLDGARCTAHDEAIGTPTYMAPEQARGEHSAGLCDVYALGIVAYQALTGSAPFVGRTPVEILVQHLNKAPAPLGPRCPDAPGELVELVERMLAKDPRDRPTAADIVAHVDSGDLDIPIVIDGEEITAPIKLFPNRE